jgi:hypothetical protein
VAPPNDGFPPTSDVRGDRRVSTHCGHSKIYVLDSEFRWDHDRPQPTGDRSWTSGIGCAASVSANARTSIGPPFSPLVIFLMSTSLRIERAQVREISPRPAHDRLHKERGHGLSARGRAVAQRPGPARQGTRPPCGTGKFKRSQAAVPSPRVLAQWRKRTP